MNKNNQQPQRVTPAAPEPVNALAAASLAPATLPLSEAPRAEASAPPATEPTSQHDAGTIATEAAAISERPQADPVGPGRTRIPFGSSVARLEYPPRPGFHRHWFNDVPGRIDRAKAAGYDHVNDANGRSVSRPAGTSEGGAGLHAFLMEQPQHWHDEDVALGQKGPDEIDYAIKHGAIGREKDGAESNVRYQPEGRGISIRKGPMR